MTDKTPDPTAQVPTENQQPSIEQMKEMVQNQLVNVQRTNRIYHNLVALVSQSNYRGDAAEAVWEALTHCRQMTLNLEAQERDLSAHLNHLTPAPVAPVGKARPNLVLTKQKAKGKKK